MKLFKLTILALVAAFMMTAQAIAADDIKIGYVDLSRLFDEYHKTKVLDEQLEGKHKNYEAERKTMLDKIREAQGKLALLAEDQKAQTEAQIETLKSELIEFDRQKQADLTKERNEVIREILLEIEKTVSTYAEKQDFSVILNDRVLIYGNQTMNVTDQVLEKLNENK